MVQPNYPPELKRGWQDSDTGIINSSTSPKMHRYGRGQRRSPGDPRGIPMTYAGFRSFADVTLKASPSYVGGGNSYLPTSDEGTYMALVYQGNSNTQIDLARNKSWSKLMERVKGDSSTLAVTAAEGREAFEMIAKRTTGLYRAYKALRKGDFRKFLRELSVDPKRKHRSVIRTSADEASGLWLEYWFGWSPTVQDIGSAVYALTGTPIIGAVRERGKAKFHLPSKKTTVGNSSRRITTEAGFGFIGQGAEFRLENQNLFLCNRLGLVNPIVVAWELVPFSFVVDWFTKFGDVLDSYTDLVGLRAYQQWNMTYCRIEQTTDYFHVRTPNNRCQIKGVQYVCRRGTAFLKPVPVFPKLANFGNSLTRAATAVSLLNQVFIAK